MKIRISLFFVLFIFLVQMQGSACTIFYASRDGVILAGNNEDWEDPSTKMWFFPPAGNMHGWIKFGFGSGFPQGGMNDQGLFWDATACSYLAMPYSEANKEIYFGPVMQKVIEECGNIEDAQMIFAQYFCEDQYKAQYLVGDSSGHSMIVEGDNIIVNEDSYQVLTNFYQSHPELGGYPCWRFETATEMLSSNDKLTPYFAGSVLSATHQEGRYPSQYSNIYDLKNGLIYLFYYHNYEEFIKIDLIEELKKGYRSYNIPELFSKVKLVYPVDGEEVNSLAVTFRWEGIPGNNYELIYSTISDFSGYISTTEMDHKPDTSAHASLVYLAGFLLLSYLLIKEKKMHYSLIIIMFTMLFHFHCKKEDDNSSSIVEVEEFTKTIADLAPGTTYYWKIIAHPVSGDDFYSETVVRHFKLN